MLNLSAARPSHLCSGKLHAHGSVRIAHRNHQQGEGAQPTYKSLGRSHTRCQIDVCTLSSVTGLGFFVFFFLTNLRTGHFTGGQTPCDFVIRNVTRFHRDCWSQAWGQNPPPERAKDRQRGGRGVRMPALLRYPRRHPIGVDSELDRSARASESRGLALSVEQEIYLRDTPAGAR